MSGTSDSIMASELLHQGQSRIWISALSRIPLFTSLLSPQSLQPGVKQTPVADELMSVQCFTVPARPDISPCLLQVLGQILQASSSNNPIPEVHVEALSHTLSYQVWESGAGMFVLGPGDLRDPSRHP